jgi:hypothetical protein
MVKNESGRRPVPRWLIYSGIGLMVLVAAAIVGAIYAGPWVHTRALQMLQSRSEGQVELQDFHIYFFPTPRITGSGIVIRHHGRTDVPPLIQISEFSATASLAGLFEKPVHIHSVHLTGLTIHFPPKEKRGQPMDSKTKDVPFLIDELVSDQTELDMLPGNPEKPIHQFLIHQLVMHHVGRGQPAPFEAYLKNAAPPGEIHVKGEFGPWAADNPRVTPLDANYTFDKADLSVFKGVSGLLSSTGKFGGPLDNLHVEGETATPDFAVTSGGHPMMLKTTFNATVDGTNGDTLLHPVIAVLGESTLVCNGSVVRPPDGKGREVLLEVTATHARIQDMLRLAVPTSKSPFTGVVNLKTTFDLPSSAQEGGEVVDRLKLKGRFGIADVAFTDPKIRSKIENLSDRAQGKPNDQHEDDPLSKLKGDFALGHAIITMRNLGFSVAGASVNLDGTYGLRTEDLDFHGKARLDAKPSQMITGFKSTLLKPFDHFFRKNGATEIPIKVTGKRDHPSFGLDFHRKSEKGR